MPNSYVGRGWDGPVRAKAIELARSTDYTAAEIRRALEGLFPKQRAGIPGPRAVEKLVRAARAEPDASADWTLEMSRPEDAALILPVARWRLGRGYKPLTRDVARWIARVRRIAPDLDDIESINAMAVLAQRGGRDLANAQTILAFRPWTPDGRDDLARAVGQGHVGSDVGYLVGLERQAAMEQLAARNKQGALRRGQTVINANSPIWDKIERERNDEQR
jgi:hypothetical protein